MIQKMFVNMLEVSIIVSAIILAVCILSPLLDKKYIAKWKYIVWLGITVRLLVPIPITFPDAPIQIDPAQVIQKSSNWQANLFSNQLMNEEFTTGSVVAKQDSFFSDLSVFNAAVGIWLVGTVVFSVYHLFGYFNFTRNSKRWSLARTPDQEKLFAQVKAEMGIQRNVSLRRSKIVKSPMMYGIIHPTVIIPHTEYSETDLYLILKHELTHYKRHDIELKFVLFLVRSFYWFNPFVHLMSKKFNETIELICDEYVIRGKDSSYKKRYMETILHSVEQQTGRSSIFTSNYSGGLKVVKKRFQNISFNGSKKKGIVALAAFTIVCVASSSLVVFGASAGDGNAKKVIEETQTTPHKEVMDSMSGVVGTQVPSEKIVGVLAESERNTKLEKIIIEYFEIPLEYLKTTKYYYNYVDLDEDGKDEILTVVMGPYSSGSGGSTALYVTKTDSGDLLVNQALTLIQTPVIISDNVTNGYKEIVVMNSGGGASGNYITLTVSEGKYNSVNDGTPIDGLEGISGKAIINNDIAKEMEEGKALYLQDK
ncbi:M56 family metallopeptidase [Psychrobacillus sp.]|uniref:M56 family metallopeptidase n=1 Tax=Psychrobacillus sp. TaxID=1871623 RepID=UPI0028BE954D|nr:M56 family metallopeptidase [Psychrobacillus sp.]